MAVNEVIFNGETLIDLTSDTVDENSLLEGYTAHGKDGNIVVGKLQIPSNSGITEETDPVFTASAAHGITQENINSWTALATSSSSALTAGSTKFTSTSDFKAYKRGTCGMFVIRNGVTSSQWSSGSTYTIAVLPSGYRPLASMSKDVLLNSGGSRGHLTINSNGNITIVPRANISKGNTVNFFETFVI